MANEFTIATGLIDFRTLGFSAAIKSINDIQDAMRNMQAVIAGATGGTVTSVNNVSRSYDNVADSIQDVQQIQVEVTQKNGWDEVADGIYKALMGLKLFHEFYKKYRDLRASGQSRRNALVDTLLPTELADTAKKIANDPFGALRGMRRGSPFRASLPAPAPQPPPLPRLNVPGRGFAMPAIPSVAPAAAALSRLAPVLAGVAAAAIPVAVALAAVSVATMLLKATISGFVSLVRAGAAIGGEFSKQWTKAFGEIDDLANTVIGNIGESFAKALQPLLPTVKQMVELASRLGMGIGDLLTRSSGLQRIAEAAAVAGDAFLRTQEMLLSSIGLLGDLPEEIHSSSQRSQRAAFVGLEDFGRVLQGQIKPDQSLNIQKQQLEELKQINSKTTMQERVVNRVRNAVAPTGLE